MLLTPCNSPSDQETLMPKTRPLIMLSRFGESGHSAMAPLALLALSVLTFLPSFSQANYSPPVCPPPPASQIFGHPTYNDCQHIIGDLRVRDNLLHVFIPVGMRRPTTPDENLGEVTNYAWRNRVDLPILLATRNLSSPIFALTKIRR